MSLAPTGQPQSKVTITSIQQKKLHREPITCLTAYDYTSARLVDEAGIDLILVGDSLAQVMLGYENTLPVTVEEMLHHTRAVKRGVRRSLIVADMPFSSYHISRREALHNAARFLKEGGAEAVKIEGGEKRADLVARLIEAEIPVMGHIGLTPQSVHAMGGYKVQGKTLDAIEQLMRDAVSLERAGAFSIVLEGIPREVATMITRELKIPTIGIGAGPECDGQILVFHDLLGLNLGTPAKFVRQYADLRGTIASALEAYRHDVEGGAYPADSESYHLPKETAAALEPLLVRRRGPEHEHMAAD